MDDLAPRLLGAAEVFAVGITLHRSENISFRHIGDHPADDLHRLEQLLTSDRTAGISVAAFLNDRFEPDIAVGEIAGRTGIQIKTAAPRRRSGSSEIIGILF